MSTASRGASFERELKRLLESDGYAVTRAAASKGAMATLDGIEKVDLIATKVCRVTKRIFIVGFQCKLTK